MNINFQRPGDQESGPVEIEFQIKDGDWEMGKASGLLSDVGWLSSNVYAIGANEALECDEIHKDLEDGSYRATVKLVGHWSHGDSGSDYEDWVECLSIVKI